MGALLQIHDYAGSGKDYLPSYDGNGNVVALFDADASSSATACVAAYEYSPYGEFLRCEGTYAKENPFRFSTKFTDDETGLVYYGRRYYSPSQGRFLGRDPKQEAGGLHLYGFCRNNPINLWDVLGMDPHLDSLQQTQSDLEAEIQGLRDKVGALIDDENNAYVERGTHQSEIDDLNEQISARETTLGGVQAEISSYAGTFTVGSDGDTGLYVDRNGDVGPVTFNSPTIFNDSNPAVATGTDPQTGQTWIVSMANQGLQDLTADFTPLVGSGTVLTKIVVTTTPIPMGIIQRKPGSLGKFKGTDALRAENKMARDAAKATGLTKAQKDVLHTEISSAARESGIPLTYQEILEIARDIKGGG